MSGLVRAWRRIFPTVKEIMRPSTMEDVLLYDFKREEGLKGWLTACDSAAGGRSSCEVAWHDEGAEGGGFMRFSGNVSGIMTRKMARSGFCATRSPKLSYGVNLHGYEGFAMKVRGDGRCYAVNVEPESYFDTDLYQGYIVAPAGQWTEVTFPFDGLLHTSMGRVRDEQRPLDRVSLLSLGVSISKDLDQGREGPFQLDIQWVRARHLVDNSEAGRERLARAQVQDPRFRSAEQEEAISGGREEGGGASQDDDLFGLPEEKPPQRRQ